MTAFVIVALVILFAINSFNLYIVSNLCVIILNVFNPNKTEKMEGEFYETLKGDKLFSIFRIPRRRINANTKTKRLPANKTNRRIRK